jgi:hypothetical protein
MIEKRDLQAAVKHGLEETAKPHPRTGEGRLKFTYNGIVYITDLTGTREVTSYAAENLPLHKVDIDASLSREITEQKRRIESGQTAITSHTVLVVDQSASMKNSDIMGHRSRSRGAFYTLASELIAQPLMRDQLSFTDVVTIIEMRDTADIITFQEPMTWELHNKIVDLADDPHRPRSHGNYLPALRRAAQALSLNNDNRALFLLFLSDGGPSDFATTSRSSTSFLNNRQRCTHDILSCVSDICKKFGSRLTVGTFGFAYDHDTEYGGKVFDLLRDMSCVARVSGANAYFAHGLDTANVRRALFSMSSSLQFSRTNLSSLAGGSMMRVVGAPKVKRTDLQPALEKDYMGEEQYICYYDVSRVIARLVGFDRKELRKDSIEWDWKDSLVHPHAIGIRRKTGYIGKGGERAAFEMSEITSTGAAVGQSLVGKLSIHDEPSQLEFHKLCALTQIEAGRLSKKFNDVLNEVQRRMGVSLSRIEFLQPWFYVWKDASLPGEGYAALLCERMLDSSRYKKWNDNKGGVQNLNKQQQLLDMLVPAVDDILDAIVEGEEEDDEEDQKKLGPCDDEIVDRLINDDIPQAFSHWSWSYTKGNSLVCDLQGVLGKESFQFTDPAIHSRKRRFGPTDFGRNGFCLFFQTHECNPLCRALGLRHPGVSAVFGKQ